MKYLCILVIGLALISCATSININDIHIAIGMTKDDVIKTMGYPVSVSSKGGTKYLNYRLSETDDETFRGKFIPYYVRLIKGKVDSHGRTADLRLRIGDSVNTEGIGTTFSGKFYINPVTHEIEENNYDTKFDTKRSQDTD